MICHHCQFSKVKTLSLCKRRDKGMLSYAYGWVTKSFVLLLRDLEIFFTSLPWNFSCSILKMHNTKTVVEPKTTTTNVCRNLINISCTWPYDQSILYLINILDCIFAILASFIRITELNSPSAMIQIPY